MVQRWRKQAFQFFYCFFFFLLFFFFQFGIDNLVSGGVVSDLTFGYIVNQSHFQHSGIIYFAFQIRRNEHNKKREFENMHGVIFG